MSKQDIADYVFKTPHNTNPAILNQKLDELIKEGGGGVQPDWNQNNNTQPDYVKNRPFYTGDPVETVLVEESTATFIEKNGLYVVEFPSAFKATAGETYKVSWDSTIYECTCVYMDEAYIIGNLSILGAGSDTGEPFIMSVLNGSGILIGTTDTSASHTFYISGMVATVVKIDEKYLPDTLATKIEAAQTTAETAKSTAESALTKANNAAPKSDPVFTGSFSQNRKSASTIGYRSHAEGDNSTASGDYSHAEGYATKATGDYSHAEGNSSIASGDYSHAEGETANASGKNSHAEGLGTSAISDCSHVQGRYNVRDTEKKYAHIVGNGTSNISFSNIHTLDWQGNAWYSGDVYVGSTSGTNKDAGSKKLATEEYVNSAVSGIPSGVSALFLKSSTAGSSKVFRVSVSDTGELTTEEVT